MSAVRKKRPANDFQPRPSRRSAVRVVLPRAFWSARRLAVLGVLGLFLLLFGVAAGALGDRWMMSADGVVAGREPYDIRIDAVPAKDEVDALAEQLPSHVLITKRQGQSSFGGSFSVTVRDAEEGEDVRRKQREEQAALQSSQARLLIGQRDYRKALRAAQRAASLDDANMLYRYETAVIYDLLDRPLKALPLYRQVLAAFAEQDPTLPDNLDLDGILRRANYLEKVAYRE